MENFETIEKKYKLNGQHFECDSHYYFDELEERFFFYPLSSEISNLPVEIYVDESFAYERFEHPLWIYFQNTYEEGKRNFVPMLVETTSMAENYNLELFKEDYYKIQSFVFQLKHLLKLFANEKIKTNDFESAIKEYYSYKSLQEIYNFLNIKFGLVNQLNETSNNSNMLLEMATLEPEETGLPVKLWVDTAQEYKKGGHGHRIKFQYAPHITKTKDYATFTIPEKEVKNLPKKYYNIELINKINNFVSANEKYICDLADMKISLKIFKENLIKIDTNGYPIEITKYSDYKVKQKYDKANITVVINKEGKLNCINNITNKLMFDWFDWINDFRYYSKENKWFSTAGKDNFVYIIYNDGTKHLM